MFKPYIKLLFLLLLAQSVWAQTPLKVVQIPTTGADPGVYNEDTLRHWILNKLHGGGGLIDTASIKFIGNPQAIGRFWNGVDIGIDSGLIISTGKVTSAMPPNTSGLKTDKFNTPGDPDLLGLYNMIFVNAMGGKDTAIEYTGDAAVIEFLYRPFGHEIGLDYTFASEEYPNPRATYDVDLTSFSGQPGQQIFDMFAVSIEQPNYFRNIAFIPDDLPGPPLPEPEYWVNVANINEQNNSSYYVQNPTIGFPPGIEKGTEYDGFTRKDGVDWMRIRRNDVLPCKTYRIKIAIEDFWFNYPSNEQLDGFTVNSAVFLAANSLLGGVRQPGWTVTHQFTNPNFPGQLVEGDCNNMMVTFTMEYASTYDYYIPFSVQDVYRDKFHFTYLDSGLDVLNDSVLIETGATQATILVHAINLTADIPDAVFKYAANPCDKVINPLTGHPNYTGRINLVLRNNDPFTFTVSPKTYEAFCKETIDLTITDVTQGGVTPLSYYWSGSIIPADTISYQVNNSPDVVIANVRDGCGNNSDEPIQINNKPITLHEVLDAFLCGPGQQQVVDVSAITPDYPDYTIDHVRWYKLPDNTPLGNAAGNQITVVYDDVVGDGIWTCGFEITDCCGGTQTGTFLVNQSELTLGDDVWICNGESYELIANAQAHWFKWYPTNDPTNILSTTNSVEVAPDVTTEYTLRILDLCYVEQVATITVNVDQFVPDFTITPSSAEICLGEQITLTSSVPANSYLWQPGGQTTPSIDLVPATTGTFTYTLTASSDYCLDKEVSKSFEVFPVPMSEFSFTPATEACKGEDIQFTYAGDPNVPDFNWDFGDGSPTESVPNPIHAYQTDGTFTVSLHVDQYICSNDSSVEILINPLPVAAFSPDGLEGCLPVTVSFTDQTQDAFPNAIYEWDFGDGTTSNDKNPTHTYDRAGSYQVSLTVRNTDRCLDSFQYPDPVLASPNPEASATADPYLTTLDTPEIAFFNLSTSDSAIVNYIWNFGDGSTPVNEENPTHTFLNAGDYFVQLSVETVNGCKSDTTIQVGLTEFVKMFFPNAFTPNGDGLNDVFEIKGTPITDFNLYIYDRWGGQVFSTHDFNTRWDGTNMSGEPVPAGVYLYQVTGTDYLLQPISFKGTVTVVR